jgi:hypothetical protein
MMGTRPQTLYGLADSPVGLAAWLFDHGDGYGQPAAAVTSAVLGRTINGHAAGDLTRDDVLDDFTLYWLTNTAISPARFYWESHINLYNAADVSIPAAVTVFPRENYEAPRATVSFSGQRVAARRRRRSTSASSGTLIRKGRMPLPAGAATTCDGSRLAAPAAVMPIMAVPKSRRRSLLIASLVMLVSVFVMALSCTRICN